MTPETKEKMRERMLGNTYTLGKTWKKNVQEHEHVKWAGDKVGKRAVHIWVEKWKGKPDTCESCGKTGLKGYQIHWANVDHKYKRVLEDYIRMCVKCHGKYDKEHGFRKRDGVYIKDVSQLDSLLEMKTNIQQGKK